MIWPHLPLQTKGLLLPYTTPSTIPYPSYSCTDLKLCSLCLPGTLHQLFPLPELFFLSLLHLASSQASSFRFIGLEVTASRKSS